MTDDADRGLNMVIGIALFSALVSALYGTAKPPEPVEPEPPGLAPPAPMPPPPTPFIPTPMPGPTPGPPPVGPGGYLCQVCASQGRTLSFSTVEELMSHMDLVHGLAPAPAPTPPPLAPTPPPPSPTPPPGDAIYVETYRDVRIYSKTYYEDLVYVSDLTGTLEARTLKIMRGWIDIKLGGELKITGLSGTERDRVESALGRRVF